MSHPPVTHVAVKPSVKHERIGSAGIPPGSSTSGHWEPIPDAVEGTGFRTFDERTGQPVEVRLLPNMDTESQSALTRTIRLVGLVGLTGGTGTRQVLHVDADTRPARIVVDAPTRQSLADFAEGATNDDKLTVLATLFELISRSTACGLVHGCLSPDRVGVKNDSRPTAVVDYMERFYAGDGTNNVALPEDADDDLEAAIEIAKSVLRQSDELSSAGNQATADRLQRLIDTELDREGIAKQFDDWLQCLRAHPGRHQSDSS